MGCLATLDIVYVQRCPHQMSTIYVLGRDKQRKKAFMGHTLTHSLTQMQTPQDTHTHTNRSILILFFI